tara:strand:- start:56 stop:508 length:453 start_codon:yes stop_codon:yes gene_type:complete
MWRRFVFLVSVCLVAGTVSNGSVAAEDSHIGIVKEVSGDASIERNGSSLTAETGTKIQNGDKLMTGVDSAMGVTFRDGSLMSMGPDALLEMDELIYEPQQGKVSMIGSFIQGTFAHVSGGIGRLKPEAVSFKTPTATIGIRGTRFVVRVP